MVSFFKNILEFPIQHVYFFYPNKYINILYSYILIYYYAITVKLFKERNYTLNDEFNCTVCRLGSSLAHKIWRKEIKKNQENEKIWKNALVLELFLKYN